MTVCKLEESVTSVVVRFDKPFKNRRKTNEKRITFNCSSSGRWGNNKPSTTLAVKKQIVNKLIAEGQLTQQKVKERGGINKIIDVKSVDLNKDGKSDFIVSCSCELMEAIYVSRKTANDVENNFEGSQRQIITPLNSYTKGWRNLRLTSYRSINGATSSETLRWNGTEYK